MRLHPRRILTAFLACVVIVMFRATLLHVEIGEGFSMDQLDSLPREGPTGRQPRTKQEWVFRIPWPNFMKVHWRAAKEEKLRVWPSGWNETDDRILNQLQFIPDSFRNTSELKTILVYTGLPASIRRGQQQFLFDKCAVDKCSLITDKKQGPKADVVLWQQSIQKPSWKKPPNQVWVLYFLESPLHTPMLGGFKNLINWTATYRRDSTIVTPYEKFVPYKHPKTVLRNFATGKTRKVAWFVSNCGAKSGRMAYVKELQKHIEVDIYGLCGPFKCTRGPKSKCDAMLSKVYKFYLAFENSNCKDYVTEKLYWNAYLNDIVPVVMGARPIDYKLSTPPNSVIHVEDFTSPKDLAEYLLKLDTNDDLYNEYLKWKGTGSFINTKFWCRLCAMAHDTSRKTWYTDISKWWRGQGVCTTAKDKKWASWKNTKQDNKEPNPFVVIKQNTPG